MSHAMSRLDGRAARRFRFASAGALVALSLVPLPALPGHVVPQVRAVEAQQQVRGSPAQRPSETRQEMMARIQRNYEQRMARELELTPDQLVAVRSIMTEFRSTRGEMLRERFQLRQDLERHLGTRGSDAEARRLLDRSRALRAREVDVQRMEEDRLLTVISTSQLLRFHRMREDFSDSIRRLEVQDPPRRPGPPGGGQLP
jgi:hypothetical protein